MWMQYEFLFLQLYTICYTSIPTRRNEPHRYFFHRGDDDHKWRRRLSRFLHARATTQRWCCALFFTYHILLHPSSHCMWQVFLAFDWKSMRSSEYICCKYETNYKNLNTYIYFCRMLPLQRLCLSQHHVRSCSPIL